MSSDAFWTMEAPDGSLDVFTCPGCEMTQTAENVRERGGCEYCDYDLEGEE